MTGILALGEFGLLYVLADVLKLDSDAGRGDPALYWVSWMLAAITRIALLPIVSLTYIESAAEFRRIEWSVPPSAVSLPVVASAGVRRRARPRRPGGLRGSRPATRASAEPLRGPPPSRREPRP